MLTVTWSNIFLVSHVQKENKPSGKMCNVPLLEPVTWRSQQTEDCKFDPEKSLVAQTDAPSQQPLHLQVHEGKKQQPRARQDLGGDTCDKVGQNTSLLRGALSSIVVARTELLRCAHSKNAS
jgi:hypothetical protein